MRKVLFMAFALMASLTGFAQGNLALNKQAYASSVSDENDALTAAKAVDGDAGTKWASNYGTKDATMTDEQKAAQWFYVDLGSEVDVNTVKITWDNQAAHKFDIRYSTADPADAPKTAGTAALTALAGTDNKQDTYKLDASVKARYIILDLQERGPWGYGICELEVYNIDYAAAKLTTLTVQPAIFKAGEATTFTLTAIDDFNNTMDGITYTVAGEAFANPYTAAAAGAVTITGTDAKGNTATATVYAMGDATAPTAPAADAVFQAIYTSDQAATWAVAYNGGATEGDELTLGSAKVKTFSNTKCVFFTNEEKWADIYNVNINPAASQYGKLHLSIFTPAAVEGKVVLENTNKIAAETAFTTKAGEWTNVEIDLDGETFIKAMSVRNTGGQDGASIGDIALANIYFSKAEENPDAGKVVALTVDPTIVAVGVPTEMTINPTDNKGVTITEGVTISATGLADGKLTAAEAGQVTVTASTNEGAQTATAVVYAVAAPERTAKTADAELLQSGKSTTGQGTDWEGGYTAQPNLVYADNTEAYHAKNVKTLYLSNPGLTAEQMADYNVFHFDVFSTVDDEEASVVLEGINATKTFAAKAGQWTSVDVQIEPAATSWIKIKFTADNAEILVDNVYFTTKVDETAPVIGEVTAEATYAGAVISIEGTDDSDGDITYTVTVGQNEKTATAQSGKTATVTISGLKQGTTYQATIVAADAAGNKSAEKTVEFTTKTLDAIPAAPAPTAAKDHVQGVYTDAYGTFDGVQFMNWHKVDVVAEEIAASDNADDKIYRIYTNAGFNFYGMQLGTQEFDLSKFKTIHIDIWSSAEATIGFSPINQATEPHTAKKELTLQKGWNQFDIAVTDYSGTMDVTVVDQLEFFDAPADLIIGIDNIYFQSEDVVTAISTIAATQAAEGAWYTLAGQRVAAPTAKGIYIHNGRKVIVK